MIHQGSTPLPGSPEWEALSEAEQGAVYAAYRAINEDPSATPGLRMQPPETATTVRVQDGQTLTTDGPFVEVKEALGGYLFYEAEDLDGRSSSPRASPRRAWAARSRSARSPSDAPRSSRRFAINGRACWRR